MKKNIKDETSQTAEQPISSVNKYFTKEIRSQMSDMTTKEMENILREMIDTRQFIALIKYSNMRTLYIDMTLRTTNPVKDPHVISYHQGAFAGICDLETYVIELNAPKVEAEDNDEENKTEGVII